MRRHSLAAALIVFLAPATALADRGAVTVELAPSLTWWPAWGPPLGSGSGVAGTTVGGLAGVRYALRHELELTANGFYEAPAEFTNPGTTIGSDAGPLTGTSRATVSRWGVLLGARWVRGLAWRWFVGGEVGWAQQRLTRLDHIDVSDPGNPQSFGLGLADRSNNALALSTLAGIEWQFADHWSVVVAPRVQVMLGSVGHVAVTLPVGVAWSRYGNK